MPVPGGTARPRPEATVPLDGRSLLPLLEGGAGEDWPERTLFLQSHRGDAPERYRAFAAIERRWKLVQPLSFRDPAPADAPFELYDLEADPGETDNVAGGHPSVVDRLKTAYGEWFDDVSATRGYDAQPIFVGAPEQPTVTLTRQDWRAIGGDNWGPGGMGEWHVDVREAAAYDVTVDYHTDNVRSVNLRIGDVELQAEAGAGQSANFEAVALPVGATKVQALVDAGGDSEGAWFVTIKKR